MSQTAPLLRGAKQAPKVIVEAPAVTNTYQNLGAVVDLAFFATSQ